jgi:hypothetical protein
LRLGANIGYLKFTPRATWNPFWSPPIECPALVSGEPASLFFLLSGLVDRRRVFTQG